LISNINLTSDETYLRDYSNKSGDYNRQYYDSRLVATKAWDHWLTAAQAIYTQDFTTGSNAGTLQRLPELLAYGVRQPLPYLPLQLDLDLRATHYYRENGTQGQRAILTPQLVGNQALFGGRLNARLSAGAQLRAYNVEDATPTTEEQALVAVPELNAELASSFSRTLDGNLLGFKLLRHELTPSVAYRYVVDRDQQQYPLFDQNDRILHQNLIYLSLASHLGGRLEDESGGAHYRHLQTLRLKQGYSLSGDRPDLLDLVPDDQRPWSNLTLESETWLHTRFRLLADAGYNHYDNRFTSTALGGDYNDGRGNSIGLSYRWADQQVEYLEGRVTTTLLRPVYLSYIQRYSFDRKDFLEQELDLEYRHQCWSIFASYQERLGNRSVTVNVNLAGLFTSSGSRTSSLGRQESTR
jgi:LPS-assembly protein